MPNLRRTLSSFVILLAVTALTACTKPQPRDGRSDAVEPVGGGDRPTAATAPASGHEPALTGEAWLWVRTLYSDDTEVAPARPESYTVRFQEGGEVEVQADCNLKGGTYAVDGTSLSITLATSTMAECEQGSLEGRFARGLEAAQSFLFSEGDLYLALKYDSGTMRLTRAR